MPITNCTFVSYGLKSIMVILTLLVLSQPVMVDGMPDKAVSLLIDVKLLATVFTWASRMNFPDA
jgi:hypothetical protein